LDLNLEYRTEIRIYSLSASSTITSTDVTGEDHETSQRNVLDLNYKRLWPNRWLVSGFLKGERNDELGLDLRTSVGGGGGRILTQSNHSRVLIESGLMVSHEDRAEGEDAVDDAEDNDSIEAYVSLHWDWFRFDSPELDLSSALDVIPSLTDSGRVRTEFDVALKWEIIHEFFWEISFYNSYDNKPATEGASTSDYGIVTSVGYDF
jgi:hypothetical protein